MHALVLEEPRGNHNPTTKDSMSFSFSCIYYNLYKYGNERALAGALETHKNVRAEACGSFRRVSAAQAHSICAQSASKFPALSRKLNLCVSSESALRKPVQTTVG